VRFEDLPKSLQDQVSAKLGEKPRRKKDRTGDGRTACDGTCVCGERFTSTVKWERHSDESGHRRFEVIR
jgi:hypothetical protein